MEQMYRLQKMLGPHPAIGIRVGTLGKCSLSLVYDQQDIVRGDGVAFLDPYFFHHPIAGGGDDILHLHRLDFHYGQSCGYPISRGDHDLKY